MELANVQDKADNLEASLRDARWAVWLVSPTGDGETEVGSLLRLREIEDAKDDALDALDKAQWEMDKMKRDFDYEILRVKESVREDLGRRYERDLKTRDEFIELLKAKLAVSPSSACTGNVRSLGGGSGESKSMEDVSISYSNRLKLPTLPKFSGEDRDDVDSLWRWLAKLEKHAELQHWTEHEKLVQFELHLAGRAERLYEILPSQSKESYRKATTALQERLNPVERPWFPHSLCNVSNSQTSPLMSSCMIWKSCLSAAMDVKRGWMIRVKRC